MTIDPPDAQSIGVPLLHPPEVVSVGFGLHGVRERVERWLLPELYSLHIYDWTGELKIGEVLHQIRPGDLSIVPAGTAMEYRYTGPSPHIYAHFRAAEDDPLVTVPAVQPLGRDVQRLRTRLAEVSAMTEPLQRSAEVWSVLWAAATGRREPRTQNGNPNHAVRAAVDYIDRNLASSLKISEIARVALVSVSHLNRLFHANYGTSISGYIRGRRVELAEHMLRDTTRPIRSVAASIGIPDLQAFNKFCRSWLGNSPSKVRSRAPDAG